jgi:hypothetical protein
MRASDAERDTYLLLDDFGGDWFAWRETPKALIAPGRSRICWTSSDDGVQMANNTLNRAPRITACDTGAGVNYCAHALRSTASILLNEEGAFDGDGVKAHLAHDTEKKVLALRRGGWR